MAYEMLAGYLPFENIDTGILREIVLNDTAEKIEGLPSYAQDAWERALSKAPTARFGFCSDFAKALGPQLSKPPQTVSRPADPPETVFDGTVTLPNGIKLEMVKVEPGTFTMSARDGANESEEVSHNKTLTQTFYIGKYEVTNAQWCAVMGVSAPPSRKKHRCPIPG